MLTVGPTSLYAKNATMADFAGFLQRGTLDRPVLDQTGAHRAIRLPDCGGQMFR